MILTSFQKEALGLLRLELNRLNMPYCIDEYEESEVGPYITVRCNDVVSYVYTDEAGWAMNNHWQPFEKADFRSSAELIEKFVEEVAMVIRTGAVPNMSSGTKAIYFGPAIREALNVIIDHVKTAVCRRR